MLSRLDHPVVARRIALGILVVSLVGLLAYGAATDWLPWMPACDSNPSCHVLAGESLAALENAQFFVRDGVHHWLLQRHDVGGVMMTYIHNVNLGAFLVYGTALLGAQTPMPAAIVSAVAFVAGLAYAYLFAERASGARRFALLFLVLFAGELYHNTLLGLNLLRAWHWLPLFGLAYHALVVAQRGAVRRRDALALVLLAGVGFATGYELYALVGATAAWTMLLFGAGLRPRLWGTLAVALAVPVLLRQVQVIGGVGWAIWWTDLYYTAGLKAPLLRSLLALPPADQIEAWYREHAIFRGVTNSSPILDALSLLITSGRGGSWLRELGPVTLLTALIGLVLAVVLAVRARGGEPGAPARRALTVLALYLGLGTGFLVFGYHALYYFVVVHQLPLVAAPVCLAVAFVGSLLLDAAARPLPDRAAALGALSLLLFERAYQQWANVYNLGLRAHPPFTRWGPFDVGPPGGMYGSVGGLVLAVAGLVLLAGVCAGVVAFLRAGGAVSVGCATASPGARAAGPAGSGGQLDIRQAVAEQTETGQARPGARPATDAADVRPPRPSPPGPPEFAIGRADLLVLGAFVVCALILGRLSIFEGWTFVGDSDRLNTFLNVRLFEVRSIQERGTVPLWNEHLFMGSGLAGLNWMLPGGGPFPYLVALFPISEAFQVSSLISMGLLVAAAWASYLALRAYSSGPLPAAVGGLVYATSAYAVHRVAQADTSFSILIVAPLLVLLVRQTRRATATRTLPWLVAGWASLVLFTFLQEVAYVALLYGAYALYRSIRLRDPWPAAVAGLGVGLGVLIGLPRLITVGLEVLEIDRASPLRESLTIEALRYFGDGLLGRSLGEHLRLVRGGLSMHEGVQILSSGLGALSVLAVALLARSWAMRLAGLALALMLSIALSSYAGAFYQLGYGDRTYPSVALRALVLHAVIVGLVLWLVARRRVARQDGAAPGGGSRPGSSDCSETGDAALDGPFLVATVAAVLAAILVPEARLVFSYAFAVADFSHSRLSIAALLPQAALVTIMVQRLLPAGPLGSDAWAAGRSVTTRWLLAGLALGAALWLAREWAVGPVVGRVGEALPTPPWPLVTSEVYRLGTGLLLMAVIAVALARRAPPARLALAGGVLIAWLAGETIASADHRLNGPHTRLADLPFGASSYLNVPPGLLRPPTADQLAALHARLETDRYRVVLSPSGYPALVEPHLGMFWGLRLVEGYPNLPRRLTMLPWAPGTTSLRHLELNADPSPDGFPWRLLAALNVKYVLTVDRSLWLNPAPGAVDLPVDPARLRVAENPYPVAPRVFFTGIVAPTGRVPRLSGDRGDRPPPRNPPIEQPTRRSVAEGIDRERRYSTDGTATATFDGDRVWIAVDRSDEERFLVVNEMYHPAWRAWVDGQAVRVYPANLVMRGLVIPPGATTIELRYVPFLVSEAGIALFVVGIMAAGLAWWGVGRYARGGRRPGRRATAEPPAART